MQSSSDSPQCWGWTPGTFHFLLLSLALSCVASNEPFPALEPNSSDDSQVPCKAHEDCEDDEICHTDGICGVPWGTRFFITDCSFDAGNQDLQGKYRVDCTWQHEHRSGVLISLQPESWEQCALLDQAIIADLHDPARFRCHFRVDNPDEVHRGEFCLQDGCPGLGVDHFRSAQAVELRNERGDLLRFRLSPRRSEDGQN